MARCHVMGWVGLLLFVFSTLLAGCQQVGELRDTVLGNSHDVSGELTSSSDFESDSLRSIEDDDFGDDDDFVWRQEEEEHRRFLEEFERTTMVHRRTNFDLRLGGFFPMDSDFNETLSLGFTGEIEVFKNLIEVAIMHALLESLTADLRHQTRAFVHGDGQWLGATHAAESTGQNPFTRKVATKMLAPNF